MTIDYNQAILLLAETALADLATSTANNKTQRTTAAQSHFLCSWMVKSLKDKRFSKLVSDDLKLWVRLARSQGAGANLPTVMQQIVAQYRMADQRKQLGQSLIAMIEELQEAGWLVVTDTELNEKLKLESDGQSSLVICAKQWTTHICDTELVKPIQLYVRAEQTSLVTIAAKHGLLLSQPDKKSSLIKHHKTYTIKPKNQHAALTILAELT